MDGTIHGRDTGYIILAYKDYLGKWTKDTTYLKKGKFRFQGKIGEPTLAVIEGKSKIIDFNEVNSVELYIDSGQQKIELVENDYEYAKVSGSFTQKQFDTFLINVNSIKARYQGTINELTKTKYEYEAAKTEKDKNIALNKEGEIEEKLIPLQEETLREDLRFVLQHPDSYASPSILFPLTNQLPVDSAETLFNILTPRIRSSISGKYIAELLRKRKQNSIGHIPYNFKTIDFNGKETSLSQFDKKYILLDFWASWCVPCRKEIPGLKELYAQYHSRGFEIITISIDRDSAKWRKAVSEEIIYNWHNVLVNKEIDANYENVHEPIPSQILIGPDRKIVWKSNSEDTINDALRRLLK